MTEATATRPARDFPFYAGRPVSLSPLQWLLVLALTAAGFAALIALPRVWPDAMGSWASALLFPALPLVGLALTAGRHWTALFRRPTWRDLGIGVGCAVLCMAVSAFVAIVVMKTSVTASNPVIGMITAMSPAELALFFARTAPQLLGEELVTIIPFLALLTLCNATLKARRPAIVAAWIVSALIFGALHLPTYGWHVVQALVVIGSARLVLTLPYLITKNLWASTIAHITNDWTLFGVVLAASALKTA